MVVEQSSQVLRENRKQTVKAAPKQGAEEKATGTPVTKKARTKTETAAGKSFVMMSIDNFQGEEKDL